MMMLVILGQRDRAPSPGGIGGTLPTAQFLMLINSVDCDTFLGRVFCLFIFSAVSLFRLPDHLNLHL